MGSWTAPSAASGCTPHASTWSPGRAPAGAPWPRCWSPRCGAASTSSSCARRTPATRRSSPPRPRRGRSARRPVRCCSSTTALTSPSRRAPTASTSGRTTWLSRRPGRSPARELLVGLSTHAPAEIDAADADYIGVGPVHATPTKPGRLAVGLDLVRYAAEHAELPWFAIGGVDPASVAAVVDAGATRIAVVRAITDADDPEAAAAALRAALPEGGWSMAVRSRKGRPEPRTPPPVLDPDATFTERYRARTEWRNEEARADLEPLAPGERPKAVTIAAIVALVMAVAERRRRAVRPHDRRQRGQPDHAHHHHDRDPRGHRRRHARPSVLGRARLRDRPRLQITAMSLALVFTANVGDGRPAPRAGRAARRAVLEAHPRDGAHADARRGGRRATRAQPVQ